MPERRPADDRRIYCHLTATGRWPGSHCRGACRSLSGHRPKIMSSVEQIGRSPNSHLAAAGRRPLPDLYDLVQGRENPAVICWFQKSADHRTILKACEAAVNINLHCTSTSLDVPAVQILWKFTQRFLRFHAQKIFYQKFYKSLANEQF